ncbi:MAG: cyclic nucleotide-binding domain-containing protein [Rhodospirillales bacterium]
MTTKKQQFRDKDIIFREGDPATRAFTIISGKVELVTEVDGKEKHLGLLGPGKSLGDTDMSRGRHMATAIAAGTVTLRPLDQQALALVNNTAPRGPGLLARLLGPLAGPPAGSGRRFSLFGWFRQIKEASQPADPTRIEIRLAPLSAKVPAPEQDHPEATPDPTPETAIMDAFAGLEGVRVRQLKKPVTVPEDTDPDDVFNRLHWMARQTLAQAEADILIGYETDASTNRLTLRFLPLGIQNEDPAGLLHPAQTLVLPTAPGEALCALAAAVALAATVPLTDVKKNRLAKLLPEAIERAMPAVEALEDTSALTDRDKIIARLFFANLLTLVSAPSGQIEGYRMAADIYGQVIEALSEETDALDRAVAQRALGAILPVLAPQMEDLVVTEEEDKPEGPMAQAMTLLEAANEHFTREVHPKEWAALQNRLGHLCYRMDAQEGDQDLLKKALNHYQAALQVFNRVDHPMRWAEVLNNIGQAAAILGEQMKSVPLFEKAIEACSGALEVRHKLDHPMLWAATQNTLGSALFMMAKQTHDPAQLEAAREAFGLAKSVYEARGAHRLTLITEKNQARVERMMEISRPKDPPPLPWEPRDYAPHLAEVPDIEDDDEEEGDMSVYDAPQDEDEDSGLKSRAAGLS